MAKELKTMDLDRTGVYQTVNNAPDNVRNGKGEELTHCDRRSWCFSGCSFWHFFSAFWRAKSVLRAVDVIQMNRVGILVEI